MFVIIITGVVSGIVASVIFFAVLLLIRPRIEISDDISYDEDGVYWIKIVNLTRSMLKNLKYTFHCYETLGDNIFHVTHIEPNKKSLFFIDKYRRKDEDAKYAVAFSYRIQENLLRETTNKFVFIFLADHAVSNTSSCIKKEYSQYNIISGNFETGKSMKIIRRKPEQGKAFELSVSEIESTQIS